MNVMQIHEGRSIFALAWASIGITIESHSRPIVDAHHLTMFEDKQSQEIPLLPKLAPAHRLSKMYF